MSEPIDYPQLTQVSKDSAEVMAALGRDQFDKARSQREANTAPIAQEGNDHG